MKLQLLTVFIMLLFSNNGNAAVSPVKNKAFFTDSVVVTKLPATSNKILKKQRGLKEKIRLWIVNKIIQTEDSSKKKQKLGIISFVLGLTAVFTVVPAAPLAVILAIIGLITGFRSLSMQGRSKKIFAILGIIMSGLAIAFVVFLVSHFFTQNPK